MFDQASPLFCALQLSFSILCHKSKPRPPPSPHKTPPGVVIPLGSFTPYSKSCLPSSSLGSALCFPCPTQSLTTTTHLYRWHFLYLSVNTLLLSLLAFLGCPLRLLTALLAKASY